MMRGLIVAAFVGVTLIASCSDGVGPEPGSPVVDEDILAGIVGVHYGFNQAWLAWNADARPPTREDFNNGGDCEVQSGISYCGVLAGGGNGALLGCPPVIAGPTTGFCQVSQPSVGLITYADGSWYFGFELYSTSGKVDELFHWDVEGTSWSLTEGSSFAGQPEVCDIGCPEILLVQNESHILRGVASLNGDGGSELFLNLGFSPTSRYRFDVNHDGVLDSGVVRIWLTHMDRTPPPNPCDYQFPGDPLSVC